MLHFKKVGIMTENCQNYLNFNSETNKGDIGLYFGNNEKIARWRHMSEISKRNLKTMISPLLFRL